MIISFSSLVLHCSIENYNMTTYDRDTELFHDQLGTTSTLHNEGYIRAALIMIRELESDYIERSKPLIRFKERYCIAL